jgi:hypothetical protein
VHTEKRQLRLTKPQPIYIENNMNLRATFALTILLALTGCGSGDKKAVVNDKPLTDAEKAAIKAADEAVNAEESGGKPGAGS